MTKQEQDEVIRVVRRMMQTHVARKTRVQKLQMSARAADDGLQRDLINLRLLLARSGSVALQKTGAFACKD